MEILNHIFEDILIRDIAVRYGVCSKWGPRILLRNILPSLRVSKNTVRELVQVSFHLDEDNLDRELNGLMEAMDLFSFNRGTIVTMNQQDH